jgi:hypothetical protein
MKAATHNGTCQVCLRMQALPNGKLAKHGYTVEHHYFEGVCPGAAHLPLEQDRTVADEVVASLRDRAERATARAEALKAGTLLPKDAWSGNYVRTVSPAGRVRREYEMVPFADAPELHQRDAIRSAISANENDARGAIGYANSIESAANRITGKQELTPRAKDGKREIVAGMVIRIHGKDRTVLRVETRRAWGVGPYLNGQHLPHVIFANDSGAEYGYPVRLIRQASIVKAA